MNSKQFLVSWSEWKTASIAAHPPIERNNCRTYYLNPSFYKHPTGEFQFLLNKLSLVANNGRSTARIPVERYFLTQLTAEEIDGNFYSL
jgi:hypothetical protein